MDFGNVITCSVCLEKFNENLKSPRILQCGHSFCHSCIDWLLIHNSYCPACKTKIKFTTSESVPINFSLQNLINVTVQTSKSSQSILNSSKNVELIEIDIETDELVMPRPISKNEPEAKKRKYKSKGYCNEHENNKELRCKDCNIWICAMCAVLQHKKCRTLLVAEVNNEQKKKKILKKAEDKLCKKKANAERLSESLKILAKERKSLMEEIKVKVFEIKIKELKLKDHEGRIKDLEFEKSTEDKFCDKLKQLLTKAENSANDAKFSKVFRELDKFLGKNEEEISDDLPKFTLPQTLEALKNLCQNSPVYAMEDGHDSIMYGKVSVKDEQIWVYSFKPEKPDATIFNFKDLLSQFSGTSELPKKVFFKMTRKSCVEDHFDVIIETEGVSPRAKNLILLCSALKGSTYKGLSITGFTSFYEISKCPPTVIEEIRENDWKLPLMEAGVYGMKEDNSWLRIQLRSQPFYSLPGVGVVVAGLHTLKDCQGSTCKVEECGLII